MMATNGCPACKEQGTRIGTLDEHKCTNDGCLILTYLDPSDNLEDV